MFVAINDTYGGWYLPTSVMKLIGSLETVFRLVDPNFPASVDHQIQRNSPLLIYAVQKLG